MPKRTALYVTSYPPFFDTWTSQCNKVRFIDGFGAEVTQGRRRKLNLLGQELNYAVSMWIDQQNYFVTGAKPDVVDFVKFADQDEMYNGHRFCREGVNEPSMCVQRQCLS